ncbi:MAG: flagellar basal body protein [Maricaulaceae bacterium]
MPLAAKDGADRVEQMIRLTSRLIELVERETAIFLERQPHKAASFQEEKSRLANVYRHECALIKQDQRLIDGAADDRRAELRKLTEKLTHAVQANGHAIDAIKRVSEGVVKALADHVATKRMASTGYGANGRFSGPAAQNAAAAITLNQRV